MGISEGRGMRRALAIALVCGVSVYVGGPVAGQISIGFNDRMIQVAHSTSPTCQGLRDALAGISGSSLSNRFLVRLEPGVFTCGSATLFLPAGVTLEGAGPELSEIRGTVDAAVLGVVHMFGGGTLRSLKVDNTLAAAATGGIAVSIFELASTASSVLFDRVTLSAASSGPVNREIYAVNANFDATDSLLGNSDLTNTNAFYRYSRVGFATGSNYHQSCWFCFGVLGPPLDGTCN